MRSARKQARSLSGASKAAKEASISKLRKLSPLLATLLPEQVPGPDLAGIVARKEESGERAHERSGLSGVAASSATCTISVCAFLPSCSCPFPQKHFASHALFLFLCAANRDRVPLTAPSPAPPFVPHLDRQQSRDRGESGVSRRPEAQCSGTQSPRRRGAALEASVRRQEGREEAEQAQAPAPAPQDEARTACY